MSSPEGDSRGQIYKQWRILIYQERPSVKTGKTWHYSTLYRVEATLFGAGDKPIIFKSLDAEAAVAEVKRRIDNL